MHNFSRATDCTTAARRVLLVLAAMVGMLFPVASASAATFVNDTMTGTNGTTLLAHGGWTGPYGGGDMILDTNRAKTSNSNIAMYLATGAPANANYTVSADIYKAGSVLNLGVTCRHQAYPNVSTFYFLRYSYLGNLELLKSITGGGAMTSLGTSAQTAAVGSTHNISLTCNGSSLTGKWDGATVITATDSAITAAGKPGMWALSDATAGGHLDNYLATDVVASGCDLNATPANFAAQVTASSAGQTICLGTGSYGTWTGTSKAITIKPQSGASPTMLVDFNSGDTGFTVDGLGGMGGSIQNGASNITIKNSAFTSQLLIENTANGSGILLDHNTHNNININCQPCVAGRIEADGAFTVQNSTLSGGDSDGVQIGTTRIVNILNNEFANICENGPNHTDHIQWYGGTNTVVRGNYFHTEAPCGTQILSAFQGTSGNLIEDNVVKTNSRPWSVELYSDDGSIVRHNTFVYGSCDFSMSCGHINLDQSAGTPVAGHTPGQNTQIYDNVATQIDIGGGSTTSRRDHNMMRTTALSGDFIGTPTFVGGASPTTYAGFKLTAGSAGHNAASDGLDVGIR